jgi:hypothetical protein
VHHISFSFSDQSFSLVVMSVAKRPLCLFLVPENVNESAVRQSISHWRGLDSCSPLSLAMPAPWDYQGNTMRAVRHPKENPAARANIRA